MKGLLADYRSTLKAPEIEETLDVVFYRPLAFGLVRLTLPTVVSPNHLTLLSLLFAILGGWLLFQGTATALAWAAVAIVLHNVFDCADGMLARARGIRSPLGYVLDGLAGYLGATALILGFGKVAGDRAGHPLFWWAFTVAAGISLAWWCAVVDGLRLDWQRRVHGHCCNRAAELAALEDEAAGWRRAGTHHWQRLLVAAYVVYVRLWEGRTPRERVESPDDTLPTAAWAAANRPILRLAVEAGPTMQLTVMAVACALNRPEWFLWAAVVAANLWAGIVLLARFAVRQRLLATSFEEA